MSQREIWIRTFPRYFKTFEQFNQVGVSSLMATHDIKLLDKNKKELTLSNGVLIDKSEQIEGGMRLFVG